LTVSNHAQASVVNGNRKLISCRHTDHYSVAVDIGQTWLGQPDLIVD